MTTPSRRALLCAAIISSGGCALLTKGDPLLIRYFTAERTPSAATATATSGPALRLGVVSGAADLRTRLAFRSADQELGYDDELRWTEPPDVYLRRALSRALFEERAVVEAVSGAAPVLEVELVAFEERTVAPRAAHAQAVMRLHDGRRVTVQRTLVVDVPIAGEATPEVVVRALSEALYRLADQVASLVVARLDGAPRR